MSTISLGIIMNGVTGRMGTNQHLVRSILAIRDQGGIPAGDGRTIMPVPMLAGRNEDKLRALAEEHGGLAWTTDVEALLKDPVFPIYFDAQTTPRRYEWVKKAIAAGKHVYCEKPVATTSAEAMELYRLAEAADIKHGVVQDKLWLPGLVKLKRLIDEGFFGEILSVRGEFGYWVFTGHDQTPQRPSWNYRKEDGGGIIVDMLCHWRYVIDNLFGNVTSVSCLGATHIPERIDENGKPYACTADDAAYATFVTDRGIICHVNSSWCVRVRRDDLVVFQVDGTKGSAVAGLRDCRIQSAANTPRPRLESRCARHRGLLGRLGRRARTGRGERLQGPVGTVPPPRRARRTLSLGSPRRRERRPTRRTRHRVLDQARLGGYTGTNVASIPTLHPMHVHCASYMHVHNFELLFQFSNT